MIKFLINDFKKDIQTIRDLHSGKINPVKRIKEIFKGISLDNFLKTNFLFFLIILLAFCSGWFVAGQYYSVQCNEAILEVTDEYNNQLGIYDINELMINNNINIRGENELGNNIN